jgi:hypothetical protein
MALAGDLSGQWVAQCIGQPARGFEQPLEPDRCDNAHPVEEVHEVLAGDVALRTWSEWAAADPPILATIATLTWGER